MRFLLLVALLLGTIALAQQPDDNTLVIAQARSVTSLDPAAIADLATFNISKGLLFATLVDIDADGKVTPYLAESYTVSEDGLETSFTLREGLNCHNGEPLTAEDVVYSIKRAADPNNAFTGNIVNFVFPNIGYVDARVDGELVATVITNQYNPAAVPFMADIMVHCKDSYEQMSLDQAANSPIGSGPYRLVEYIRGDRVVLEKVADYPLQSAGWERLVWRTIPEASTQAAELIAGNVDIVAGIVSDHVDAINSSGTASVKPVMGTRRIAIWFSFSDNAAKSTPGGAAIQDRAVRVALQYAVDVPAICANLLGVECERMTTLVNPPNDNPNLAPYPYEPETAERLLDEAGYPRGADGVRFTLNLQTPNGSFPNDVNVALTVAQYFEDIGIPTSVEPMEPASVFQPLTRAREAGPMYMNSIGGGTWSAIRDMGLYMSRETNNNYNDWDNPEWFALFSQMLQERDDAARQEIVNEMLEIFYNDPPWLMLYFLPNFYGVSDRIDWTPRRDDRIDPFTVTLSTN